MNAPSRREFLKCTAVAGAAVTVGQFALGTGGSAAEPGSPSSGPGPTGTVPHPSWIDRPMRWAQLTLVENDPVKYDAQFWLDYFARTKADAVCLSAGGCVAYYPTKIPFHHRSAWLGHRDVFGELVTGCRKLGMVVIARTDPHATYDDAEAAHPEWIQVTADGRRRRHWASPEMWVTCGLGPYNFDFMTGVHREIMREYRIDGIFINRWEGSGMCYCASCRDNFRAATGFELPRTDDPHDAARHAYILWRQQRLFDLWRTWDSAVRAINPDSCVIPNTGGGATSSLDMVRIGELAPMLVADRQARRGVMAPWANGKNGKEFRATMGAKPVIGLFSVGLEEPERWKDSVQNGNEIKLWAIDGVANGMRPWYSKFSGTLHDRRWLDPVAELFDWCAAHERWLRNERPLARVGLVYSQQTGWFYRPTRGAPNPIEDAALGWYQVLIEARVPFEMVHDRLLDPPHLASFDTLILPNIAALSDTQCAQLRAFVARGGGLIATSETSRFDENGGERKDFGLADLFGVSFAGRIEGPMHNAYVELRHDLAPNHPLLAGLEDAPRTIHGVWRIEVTPRASFGPAPLTLIPAYPDLPMEKVYPRVEHTTVAQVFLRDVGAGRVAYFPWDIDRTFWEVLDGDHGTLLRNAVAWATRPPPPVTVHGPGVLDVTYWQQQDSVTVHLVNLTNPMMMKGPVRELYPVGAQQVRLRLPDARRVRSAHLLVADQPVPFDVDSDAIVLTIPGIVLHEVVALEFGS
ncbi:MAG TPA: beta-galactosidase trimerization domain-containing protein [Opitutaceae bacterium]|nr:beta-galactosidase trimerization domain-containing protein [Opitutaceae bacterium]